MKIELIKEEEYARPPWYHIEIDEKYIIGGGNEDEISKHYEAIINDPNILKKKMEILESREIVVSLQEESNNN